MTLWSRVKHALLMAGYCGAMQTPSCCSAVSLFSVCSIHLAIRDFVLKDSVAPTAAIKHDKAAQAEVCSWSAALQASCHWRHGQHESWACPADIQAHLAAAHGCAEARRTARDDSPLCEVQARVCCMSRHCLWYRHAAVRGSSRVRPILCTSLIASFLRGSSASLRASTVSHILRPASA